MTPRLRSKSYVTGRHALAFKRKHAISYRLITYSFHYDGM
jgi:hypothetical protein